MTAPELSLSPSLLKRVFQNRRLAFLWSGQLISQAGDSVFDIALLWLLLEMTGSSSLTGLIAMSAYLPSLLFGMFAGTLADRCDRRTLLLV
ncbi:MAG: MFS transporter, partial [Candidatus Cloacimonetes bacterium]|nr:MFS transporter [Candidatus Cloacimonadota bacterium]